MTISVLRKELTNSKFSQGVVSFYLKRVTNIIIDSKYRTMRIRYIPLVLAFCCCLYTVNAQEGDTLPLTFDVDKFFHQHDDKIGKKAIPFDAVDYKDLHHRSSDYLGKILIVYFWDIWSWDSCEDQTEALNHIAEKYREEVAIVSFVSGAIQLDEIAFLQSHPVNFPVIPNSRGFGFEYHGYKTGIPVLFFIDEKGYWQKVVIEASDIENQLMGMLKQ